MHRYNHAGFRSLVARHMPAHLLARLHGYMAGNAPHDAKTRAAVRERYLDVAAWDVEMAARALYRGNGMHA